MPLRRVLAWPELENGWACRATRVAGALAAWGADAMHMKFDAGGQDGGQTAALEPPRPAAASEQRHNLARWLYWSREIRPPMGDGLFGEPGWDLLLDLYIREKSGARSSVTSACIGSRAPHTTALRYVAALCDSGWVERVADPTDKRRHWLSLSGKAVNKLDRYFDRLLDTLEQIPNAPQ